jgi:apolipoprotein N-acyltransferase
MTWKKSCLWVLFAVACFHAAYTSIHHPALGWFIIGYAYALVQLAGQPTVRRAFYFGLVTGYLCFAPQLFFMWKIFSAFAVILWLVLAFWIGLFTATVCGSFQRWGRDKALWLIPVIWMGLEYFRSELYYLRFSWLNIGYALPLPAYHLAPIGVYGLGFCVFTLAAVICGVCVLKTGRGRLVAFLGAVALFLIISFLIGYFPAPKMVQPPLVITGVQTEFPGEQVLPKLLDKAYGRNTNAQIFVFSEYTLDGGVPDSLKDWCRDHSRYLVVGGKDVITNDTYYNTAFVLGTNGDIVFQQAKSVPIQFFHDGLPATNQDLWSSPWGRIGICICYDLSYTRVTDGLVGQGAQLLIVPTMDVADWGLHQHELHARIAPVRAAEYGVPIFRLASSGISQAVGKWGNVIAQTTPFANGEIFSAEYRLSAAGKLPWDRIVASFSVLCVCVILALLILDRKKPPVANRD